MASGAYEVIEAAKRFDSLKEAIDDCSLVVGSSARIGAKRSYAKTPEEIIPIVMEKAHSSKVALVFGRESKGLSNEEMKLCDHHMIIPTDSDFASLNVAQSAAITAAEIFRRSCKPTGFQSINRSPAETRIKEQMFEHMESVLIRARFLPEDNPLRMMRDIRRIFNSAQMDERDVRIIRGIFRKIQNMIRISDQRNAELEQALKIKNPEDLNNQ
jgi:TrmH family RNA methyltransferase